MRIAIITAGSAGMFCGSCMQDNTLARTLRLAGEDAVLVPTYTPIRVDEEDVSTDRVFLGGVNVYLDSTIPGWKRLPGWMTHWLNQPTLIRWLTKLGTTDASRLGSLTLDMLQGNHGPQRREVHEFTNFLCKELKPDVILFSNALLSGVMSELRPRFDGKILCLLQGDDVFLEELTTRWKQPVLNQLRKNCRDFDGFLTHSRYYRDFMLNYLHLPESKFRQIPLSIDTTEFRSESSLSTSQTPAADTPPRFRIGYFARICPEKGVQNLLKAAADVLPKIPHADIAIAGFLPDQHRKWFHDLLGKASQLAPNRIHWLGSPAARGDKFRIIREFNILCVPTDYHEPKGLYVLEAGLAAVPSVLPNHGAFPELIEALGHGAIYDAQGRTSLAEAILNASVSTADQKPPGRSLPDCVEQLYGMEATGERIAEIIRSV